MPLPETSPADFRRHLDALGIARGDRLAIHSRLLSFGAVAGGAAAIAQALRQAVGDEGTLVVPCYTFDASRPYDPRTRPGEATGALSEHIRRLPGAIRSLCPIHNHAAIGPAAPLLRQADPGCSLGPGSDFAILGGNGFKLLLLGCGFTEGCTYLHHMEAMAEIPYRNWIDLERQVVDEHGALQSLRVRYFARAGAALTTDFEPARQALAAAGLLASAPCVLGQSHACRLEDLDRVALALLRDDPYALVVRP